MLTEDDLRRDALSLTEDESSDVESVCGLNDAMYYDASEVNTSPSSLASTTNRNGSLVEVEEFGGDEQEYHLIDQKFGEGSISPADEAVCTSIEEKFGVSSIIPAEQGGG